MMSFTHSFAQNNVIDEVVWVIGDEAIYKSEVEEARQDAQMRGAQWNGDPYCIIPEQLAINKLFLNQAELDSISVTDDDVSAYVEARYKDYVNQAGSEEKLEEYFGMRTDQIRNRLYETSRQEYVLSKVREKIISRVLSDRLSLSNRASSSSAFHMGKSVPKKNFSSPNFSISSVANSGGINGRDELVSKYTLSSPE